MFKCIAISIKKIYQFIRALFGCNTYEEPIVICRYTTKRKLRGVSRLYKK